MQVDEMNVCSKIRCGQLLNTILFLSPFTDKIPSTDDIAESSKVLVVCQDEEKKTILLSKKTMLEALTEIGPQCMICHPCFCG